MSDPEALTAALQALQDDPINVFEFRGRLRMVVAVIISADTFVAACAERLLAGGSLPEADASALTEPLLRDEVLAFDGLTVDLAEEPALLGYARRVDAVRVACRAWR